MRNKGRSSCFTMCATYCNGKHFAGNFLQYITAFYYLIIVCLIPFQFLMYRRNGWCIHDQLYILVYQCYIFCIMDLHAFFCQLAGKPCFGTVITAHMHALFIKEPCNGAHANAADADEVYTLYVIQIH